MPIEIWRPSFSCRTASLLRVLCHMRAWMKWSPGWPAEVRINFLSIKMTAKDLPQIGERVPVKMESFPIISCSFINLQVKAAHECAQRVFRIVAVILRPSYLTLDHERNKYRPDIGSQGCGGPSCCLTSNPVDVSCSLVQGEDVHRSPSLGVCCSLLSSLGDGSERKE
jgi:hypothetical protein